MPNSKAVIQQRMARGQSGDCSDSHHDRCTADKCSCECHSNPEAFEAKRANFSEAARKAHATRGHHVTATAATGETAPKRPDLKQGVKAAVPAAAARQIKSEFALLLWAADSGAAAAVPKVWTTPEDRLQEPERTALVNATYNEIEARFPNLLKLLAKAQESATEAALIYTIAMIAAPRLARHGVIPNELASAILFAPLIAQSVGSREPAAAAVDSESAPIADRANGNGQIHVGEPFAAGPQVQAGASVQAGFSDLQHGSGDQDSPRNGRHTL
jgi:hypothetical protein